MSELSVFSAEQIDLIVSLPYKVGMNISYAEDEDGEKDDENEMNAIIKVLEAYTNTKSNNPFVKEITTQILRRKSDWSSWSENVFNIEPECEKAVKIIKPVMSEKDLRAYINMVVDVATDVAQAFGEFGSEEEKQKGVMGFIHKIFGAKDSSHQPMNVSPAEDDSIQRISIALNKYA